MTPTRAGMYLYRYIIQYDTVDKPSPNGSVRFQSPIILYPIKSVLNMSVGHVLAHIGSNFTDMFPINLNFRWGVIRKIAKKPETNLLQTAHYHFE